MCGQHRPARVTRGKTGGLQMENLSEPQTAEESRAHHNDSAECESNKKHGVYSQMARRTCVYRHNSVTGRTNKKQKL